MSVKVGWKISVDEAREDEGMEVGKLNAFLVS